MAYDRIIFLPSTTDMSAKKLAELVTDTYGRDRKAKVLAKANRVEVRWGDWSLRVSYEAGKRVLEESKEMVGACGSKRKDKKQLSACDKWVTIAADDDYDMTHFNDFVALLQSMEAQLPGAVMFVPDEEKFFDVGKFN